MNSRNDKNLFWNWEETTINSGKERIFEVGWNNEGTQEIIKTYFGLKVFLRIGNWVDRKDPRNT